MTRILIASFCFVASTTAQSQEVQVTLSNGSIIQGELRGFENGRYRFLIGGAIQEYKESEVVTLTLVERGTDTSTTDVFGSARKLLLGNDGVRASSEFHALLKTLSLNDQTKLFEILQSSLQSRIEEAFGHQFAEAFSRISGFTPPQRRTASGIFEGLAKTAEKGKRFGAAWRLLRAATRLDPDSVENWKSRRLSSAESDLAERYKAGDMAAAIEAAEEILSLQPGHPEALRIREDALYRKVQKDLADRPNSARSLLEEFLRQARREEFRRWAESELSKLRDQSPTNPTISTELTRYYPVAVGTFWEYKTGEKLGDKEIVQRLRIIDLRPEDGIHRVHFSLENVYGNYAAGRNYHVILSPTEVAPPTSGDSPSSFPMLKAPIRAGMSWEWSGPNGKFVRQIASVSDTVETPAGSFRDCVVVVYTSTTMKDGQEVRLVSRAYYAPGVGLVRLVYDNPTYRKFNLELLKRGQE